MQNNYDTVFILYIVFVITLLAWTTPDRHKDEMRAISKCYQGAKND